jgi:hypothetical protein
MPVKRKNKKKKEDSVTADAGCSSGDVHVGNSVCRGPKEVTPGIQEADWQFQVVKITEKEAEQLWKIGMRWWMMGLR